MTKPTYSFQGIELDTAKREIRSGLNRIDVSPLVFDMLVYLVEHRHEVVSKDRLIDELWPNTVVSESSVTQAVRKARAVLEDSGVDPAIIRTQHGHGYRLDAEVQVVTGDPGLGPLASPKRNLSIRIGAAVAILGGLLMTIANVSEITGWFAREDTLDVLEETQTALQDTDAKVDELLILLRNQAARSGEGFDPASEQTINEALRAIVASGNQRKAAALDTLLSGNVDEAAAAIVAVAEDQTGATEQAKAAAAASWREAGAIYFTSNFAEAVRAYRAAYDLQPGNPENAYLLAHSYLRAGQQDDAWAMLQAALDLEPDAGLEADVLRGLGAIAKQRGDYAGARSYLNGSLRLGGSERNTRRRVLTLLQIGGVDRVEGNNDAAHERFNAAVAAAEEVEDSHLLAEALNHLGIVLAVTDDFDGADAVLQRSLEIQKQRQDLAGQSTALGNLGATALRRGDPDTAESYLVQSVALGERLGWQRSIAFDLINLGGIAQARGDHTAAVGHLDRALDIATRIGLEEIRPIILANLGEVARDRGDAEAACAYWDDALPLLEAMGHGATDIVAGYRRDLACP